MLEVDDVHTYRGQNYVLQGVTLSVPDATCVTLLGRNGMGKTTLIRSLMGLTPPRTGRIRMDGVDLVRDVVNRITVLHFGEVVAEGPSDEIQRDETVRDIYLGSGTSAQGGHRC